MRPPHLFIGIDIGTSGVRAIVIDSAGGVHADAAVTLPPALRRGNTAEQPPHCWWQGVEQVLERLFHTIDPATIAAISVDGTSGSVLLADAAGEPLTPGVMYNDARAVAEAEIIAALAPRESAAHGAGSGLAKLLWLFSQSIVKPARAHTQADWVSGRLCGRLGVCDANNALKLGYDPVQRCWPAWLEALPFPVALLPEVVEAGTPLAPLRPEHAKRWGMNEGVMVVSGTTDSTAAFVASGATRPGEAVTALGSTLVLKVIAERPLFAPEYGIYSHPLGVHWLVGGASNSGGAVLRRFFSDEEMARMSQHLNPDEPTGLDYYPLLAPGERFPLCDPSLPPRLTPRPDDDVVFFQGLLEGIAAIEKLGYERLAELGAPYPVSVRSNGGGAKNSAWTRIRGRLLGVEMVTASHSEAAYGSALLARKGVSAV